MAVLDDFSIDYAGKRIYHNTGTTVYTVNALYSALQDTFDELAQMNDDVPMSAQTPTEYTLVNGWFMGDDDMKYLKQGAIQTNGWTGDEVIKVAYDVETAAFVTTDLGKPVTSTTYDGVLLDYEDNGTTGFFWVRPDAGGGNFSTAEAITVTGGTGSVTIEVGTNVSGETLWANPFTLGTIADDTKIYIVQDGAVVANTTRAATDWWGVGHINGSDGILLKVKDVGVEIANAVIEVFAHKAGTLYDHFQIDLSTGGKQPVPLAVGGDLNDAGTRRFTGDTGVGTFVAGEVIGNNAVKASATALGIVTSVGGTTAAPILTYHVITDDLTDFSGADTVEGYTSGATCNDGTPANVNGAAPAGTITLTAEFTDNLDIGDGSTGDYAITLDCDQAGGTTSLLEVYERVKFLTRRGETTTINGVQGEEFVGLSLAISYTPGTDPTTIGQIMTGGTSGATGVLAAVDAAGDIVYLHNVQGAFTDTETVTGATDGSLTNIVTSSIALPKQCAFGAFAGGKFFGAQGVYLKNVPSADVNNYTMTDLGGVVHEEPAQISITITSVATGDSILLTERSGTTIVTDQYQLTTGNIQGDTLVDLDGAPALAADIPDSGVLRIVRAADNEDHRYRYSTHNGTNQFTLVQYAGLAASGGSLTTIVDADGGFTAKDIIAGDRVRNITTGEICTVVSEDSDTQLTVTATATGFSNLDSYEIGTLTEAYTSGESVYVPFLDLVATSTSAAANIEYNTDRPVTLRVRKKGIIPFRSDSSTITATNFSLPAVRTTDSIVT